MALPMMRGKTTFMAEAMVMPVTPTVSGSFSSLSHRPIEWDIVAKRMRLKGKSKDALRERLKTLKKTHGKNLDRFPASFFRKRPVLQPTQNSTV
ncbi:hypothetical protein PR001_g24149 [Phytophthora rubi]|uniref:Uncharacterized protein n=1 Tax=Phytophthora rubi TaxID=129364 RepID=A0A6A3IG45_9STRA|nr:hypothetical protein PR001_g24149 [Phytophthora rubi]